MSAAGAAILVTFITRVPGVHYVTLHYVTSRYVVDYPSCLGSSSPPEAPPASCGGQCYRVVFGFSVPFSFWRRESCRSER